MTLTNGLKTAAVYVETLVRARIMELRHELHALEAMLPGAATASDESSKQGRRQTRQRIVKEAKIIRQQLKTTTPRVRADQRRRQIANFLHAHPGATSLEVAKHEGLVPNGRSFLEHLSSVAYAQGAGTKHDPKRWFLNAEGSHALSAEADTPVNELTTEG